MNAWLGFRLESFGLNAVTIFFRLASTSFALVSRQFEACSYSSFRALACLAWRKTGMLIFWLFWNFDAG